MRDPRELQRPQERAPRGAPREPLESLHIAPQRATRAPTEGPQESVRELSQRAPRRATTEPPDSRAQCACCATRGMEPCVADHRNAGLASVGHSSGAGVCKARSQEYCHWARATRIRGPISINIGSFFSRLWRGGLLTCSAHGHCSTDSSSSYTPTLALITAGLRAMQTEVAVRVQGSCAGMAPVLANCWL